MKKVKRMLTLALAVMMLVFATAIPASAANSDFASFPLVKAAYGRSYMAATVAIQKFYLLFSAAYAPRILQSGGTDGYFGSESVAITKSFQSGTGLTVDGEVGSNTWLKMEAFLGKISNPDVGGVAYRLNGNSVYSSHKLVIALPNNGYVAYDKDGNQTYPFYYPKY